MLNEGRWHERNDCRYFHSHTVSHVTLLVSSGKFMSGSAFFLSPPENKKAKFAFCTLKRKGRSTQKQPFLTVRFRGALLTKSVTLEFSQVTVCSVIKQYMARVFGEKIEKFGGDSKKTCHTQWLLNSRSPPVVHCCEN